MTGKQRVRPGRSCMNCGQCECYRTVRAEERMRFVPSAVLPEKLRK